MGKGFKTFMANPYWRGIYEGAPTENLKEYYRIRFDLSGFVTEEEQKDKEAEKKLKELILFKSDIQYIQRHAGSGMARHYYEGAVQKLTGKYENCGFPASLFQVEDWNPWYNPDLNQQ